ncbi:uncharacterized protein FA14DRAFT_181916 [Meira miltonrushii]|uniref:Uncharacterized protein n=1 Tax=Meira miltonrushii TaxID=1280837 RepID=A0A316V362_9BASI|nr:uncharacterized protein FA14DRAFT_181916 [Meira miltonrushii]PWN31997.1 hypothetical protein FA14DRAFT_181916 [Meira miltonrushii]
MTNTLPPHHSPRSPENFDWKQFLLDSPDHDTHNLASSSNMPAPDAPTSINRHSSEGIRSENPQREGNYEHQSLKSVPTKRKRTPSMKQVEFLDRKQERRKAVSSLIDEVRQAKKSAGQPNPDKARGRVSRDRAHGHAKRYRERMKAEIGFTSWNHARMHQLILLEKSGRLTHEQGKKLSDHRKANYLRVQQCREKKRAEKSSVQNASKPPQ